MQRTYARIASALAGMIAAAAVVTAASAQEVYVEAYEAPPVTDADIVVDDAVVVERPAPRVYGWIGPRPTDCGTFHYWNGAYCADARTEPPAP